MGFSTLISMLSSLVNTDSSVFSRLICAPFASGLSTIMNFLFGLLYNVAKYLLYLVDLVFSYIQKLAGLDMSFDSLEAMLSPDSDIVFNLLISGSDLVTAILKNLIVLAVFLIILFAIIAIIKGQIDAMRKNSEVSPFVAIKASFKAFILLLITPLLTLGGIIVSDLILQTLYRATNVSGAMSLGTQVFLTSSTSANAYRLYAQSGQKIPITFDGSKNAQISDYFAENSVTDGFIKYLQQSKTADNSVNVLYATYMTFYTEDFSNFADMNDIIYGTVSGVKDAKKEYEKYYDYYVPDDPEESDPFADLRRIESYAEQYYVMADVIDFCIQTGNTVYMKTIEEVLNSICIIPEDEALKNDSTRMQTKDVIFNQIVNQYQIEFYRSYTKDDNGEISLYDSEKLDIRSTEDYKTYVKGKRALIVFNSDYMAVTEEGGDPDVRMQIRSIHVCGETDEIMGAKYVIAVESSAYNSSGTPFNYYEPLVNGYVKNYNTEFRSDHIRNGNIIVAKGIFKDSTYPTAIKQDVNDDGEPNGILMFYREDIEGQAVGQMKDYVSLTVENNSGGFFSKLIRMIKALFNPDELIPVIDVDLDAMQLSYEKAESPTVTDTLVDGSIRIGYFMKYSPTYVTIGSVANNFCLSFTGMYKASKLNFLILIVGSFLLLRVSLSAISSLIERSYELFLIFLTYPAACATIPIDEGGAYNTWMKGYFARIFRTYGFILGINFVLMLFPVIQGIEFFTQDEVGTSKLIHRVGSLFFSVLSIREITNLLNLATAVLFELTAFTLIETAPDMISTIVAGPESALKLKDNNVFTKIKDTSVKFAKVVATTVFTPAKAVFKGGEYLFGSKEKKKAMRKKLKANILNKVGLDAFNDLSGFIPGSEIKKEFDEKARIRQSQQQQKEAEKKMFEVLDNPNASKEDAKKALAEYQASATKATKATNSAKFVCSRCGQKVTENHFVDEKRKVKDKDGKEIETSTGYKNCPNDPNPDHPKSISKSEIQQMKNSAKEDKGNNNGGGGS